MNIDTMPAGRELDALIAEKVMDYNRHEWNALYGTQLTDYCLKCGITKGRSETIASDKDFCKHDPPHYSADIAAAWQVVEKLGLIVGREILSIPNSKWIVLNTWADIDIRAVAETAPLAICRAGLKTEGIK